MKLIKTFNTRKEATTEKKKLLGEYRSLHTDYIDNKFIVTFVNGNDDPVNSEKTKQQYKKFIKFTELNKKLKDRTITYIELLELLDQDK